MQDQWGTDRETRPDSDFLPDNTYSMVLVGAVLKESSSGNAMIGATYVVHDPQEFNGRQARRSVMLEGFDDALRRFAQWVQNHGFEPPAKLSKKTIEVLLEDMVAAQPLVSVGVKANKDPQYPPNLFVNRFLEHLSGEEPEEGDDEEEVEEAKPASEKGGRRRKAAKPEHEEEEEEEGLAEGQAISWKKKDQEFTGKVVGFEGDAVIAEDEEGAEWELTESQITVLEEDEEEEEEEEEDDNREALVAIAAAIGIKVTDRTTTEKIISRLQEYEFDSTEYSKAEVALLEKLGCDVRKPVKKKKAAAKTSTSKKKTSRRK
jgi:hypothetical protein